jgi:hypothetical protein
MSWLDRFLMWLPCFASHTIRDAQGDPYLLRKYLLPKRFTGAWWPGVFLHRFYQSDSDRRPHCHPWFWSISFILTGGYTEFRYRTPWRIACDSRWTDIVSKGQWGKYLRKPWSFNVIRARDFHRAELLEPERGCWTLFVAFGHKTAERGSEWGFWDLDNDRFVGWREYLPAGADGLEGD